MSEAILPLSSRLLLVLLRLLVRFLLRFLLLLGKTDQKKMNKDIL